jgi:hypothetical protein
MNYCEFFSYTQFLGKAKDKRSSAGAIDQGNNSHLKDSDRELNSSIKDSKDLERFLLRLRDDLRAGKLAGIFVMTALNDCMLRFAGNDYFTESNKSVAREIFNELKKFGFQTNKPSFL